MLGNLDVGARLDEFRNLQASWFDDEGGAAPDHDGLNWLPDAFEEHNLDEQQLPRAHPTADGNSSLEEGLNSKEIEIKVDLKNHLGEWRVFGKKTKKSRRIKTIEDADW